MIVGIDFDNTIVCYDEVFHRCAVAQNLIPASVPENKGAVRDHLRESGREAQWTQLQGYVYGEAIKQAQPFPGVWDFFRLCRDRDAVIHIISHKTRRPAGGGAVDLHDAAHRWLEAQGCYDPDQIDLPRARVNFELTKESKLARIASLRCDYFIDDLPEFLTEPAFPEGIRRIRFDPAQRGPDIPGMRRAASWSQVTSLVFPPERAL